jgi:hypothetical protein
VNGLSERLNEIIKRLENKTLAVGFMAGATYQDGESVAVVAAKNEFGEPSNHQPPRPFFRQMVASESSTWAAKLGNCLIASQYDADRALEMIGEDMKGALQQSINEFTTPALAQFTIDKKGFSKPLIDTGQMLNSVAFEVRDRDND